MAVEPAHYFREVGANRAEKNLETPLSIESELSKLGDGDILYPNPSAGAFILQVKGAFSYAIFDKAGSLREKGTGNTKASVGLGLPTGIYMAKIQTRKKEKRLKLIKH